MNNTISASRMNSIARCLRAHYWAFEVGLKPIIDSDAIRFGSAWARATEARWRGADADGALAAAISKGGTVEPYEMAKIGAMIAAYYNVYGDAESYGSLIPEREFHFSLVGNFEAAGYIDALGTRHSDNAVILIETKSTGDRLDVDSQFWLRLRFNLQIFQYLDAARRLGLSPKEIIYDVVRRPSIRPKTITNTDSDGAKIVVDANGQRIFGKGGKPRQTADRKLGYVIQKHLETPEEFGARLLADAIARPQFYFARREVPILESDFDEFVAHRSAIINLITTRRMIQIACESRGAQPEYAWPRSVSRDACRSCAFASFCLQNVRIDPALPPSGFRISKRYEPKEKAYDEHNEADDSAE